MRRAHNAIRGKLARPRFRQVSPTRRASRDFNNLVTRGGNTTKGAFSREKGPRCYAPLPIQAKVCWLMSIMYRENYSPCLCLVKKKWWYNNLPEEMAEYVVSGKNVSDEIFRFLGNALSQDDHGQCYRGQLDFSLFMEIPTSYCIICFY